MFFATCSLAAVGRPPEMISIWSVTPEMSGEPVIRNARANARRRTAAWRHCRSRCNHAPRPGRRLATSTVTAHWPFPPHTATTRSSSTASSRFLHPIHVRTGPA